jgi:hypothetical protein
MERRVSDRPVPTERRRGRKQLEDEKMVSVNVCLTPREVKAIRRFAESHGYKVARVLRALVRRGLKSNQFTPPDQSLTL